MADTNTKNEIKKSNSEGVSSEHENGNLTDSSAGTNEKNQSEEKMSEQEKSNASVER